jgi:multisubunit Na+/H+ antiporter MnhG subunit
VTARTVTADVLLAAAVLVVLAACVGVLVMRGVYAKIHFLTPVSLVAPFLVAVAIGVRMGLRENTSDSWLALAFLVIAGPFLTHATLRAARIREKGDWRPGGAGRGVDAGGGEAAGRGGDAGDGEGADRAGEGAGPRVPGERADRPVPGGEKQ